MPNSYFRKGFNAVYHTEVKCPECKIKIPANANICPYCQTNLRSENVSRLTRWQGTALKLLFSFSAIITTILFFETNFPAIINIIIGLLIFGIGKIIINKVQNFINNQN